CAVRTRGPLALGAAPPRHRRRHRLRTRARLVRDGARVRAWLSPWQLAQVCARDARQLGVGFRGPCHLARAVRAALRAHADRRGRPASTHLHRDVSPANVLIDLQGSVRLLDFGIARSAEEPDEFKTQEGIVKGKLPYIAPEMYQGVEA